MNVVSMRHNRFEASAEYQPLLREIGLDAEAIFGHPDIKVWRSIKERENCTLDADLSDGRHIRLHIKRFHPVSGPTTPADAEARGIRALQGKNIPTTPLVGWGKLTDGRSFIVTEDLVGYRDAEKLVASGLPFDDLLQPTADLAARLHSAGLHHRDLYLCHFFANESKPSDLRLIDPGRVKTLPGWPLRRRWIVKDLAQFWYSTLSLPVTDSQRSQWLQRYSEQTHTQPSDWRAAIERKSAWIARHDAKLRRQQTGRNISIPS
jgi:heptose I phosphotransferase